jgi:hypothetical protein
MKFIELTYHGTGTDTFLLYLDDISSITQAEGCTRIDLRSRLEPTYVRESYVEIRAMLSDANGLITVTR